MSGNSPASSELRSQLQKNSRRTRNIIFGLIALVVVAVVAIVVTVFVNNADNGADGERTKVRIAVAEARDWMDTYAEVAAEKGVDIDWVATDDWVLPNTELVAGSVDANSFQHILYLSAFNANQNADLTPVFSTSIIQWGVFSDQYDSLDELPDGAKILIPDDVSNAARALYILEAVDLIEIDDNAGFFPTIEDVTSNPRNLDISQVTALTIAQLYNDPQVSAAVIGLSYFDPSQGVTAESALYLDDPTADSNLPYVNAVIVRADDADNEVWQLLEEAYRDDRTAQAQYADFGDSLVRVVIPIEELRERLSDLEELARSGS